MNLKLEFVPVNAHIDSNYPNPSSERNRLDQYIKNCDNQSFLYIVLILDRSCFHCISVQELFISYNYFGSGPRG